MNSLPGSDVPNSHDVSERLVTDTNAASDAEVTRIRVTAPEEQVNEPQLAAAVPTVVTVVIVPHRHRGGREPSGERGEPQPGLRYVLLGISHGQPAAYATLPRP